MSIAVLVLLAILTGGPTRADRSVCSETHSTQQSNTLSAQLKSGEIRITIATGGGPYHPVKTTFRVGEPVPLVITITNTGSQPIYVCGSSTVYQDRPVLLRDGKPLSYLSYRQSMLQTAERDNTCKDDNLPQQILLRPNEPVVVDWFNLAVGAQSVFDDGWYETLPVGKYTLTDRRRLSCCDGPFIETNTIEFDVIP